MPGVRVSASICDGRCRPAPPTVGRTLDLVADLIIGYSKTCWVVCWNIRHAFEISLQFYSGWNPTTTHNGGPQSFYSPSQSPLYRGIDYPGLCDEYANLLFYSNLLYVLLVKSSSYVRRSFTKLYELRIENRTLCSGVASFESNIAVRHLTSLFLPEYSEFPWLAKIDDHKNIKHEIRTIIISNTWKIV